MKKIPLLFISVAVSSISFAQCLPPSASSFLDVNNVRARINNRGTNWWDLIGNTSYEIPAGSGNHSFSAQSFWIGGLDDNQQLHLAAMKYGQDGSDYWPGPISPVGTISGNECTDNDRIYKLNKWEVAEFRQHYNEIEYVIPPDILEWPANGNPNSLAHAGAPFIDVNNDGIYNAYHGDYPAFAFNGPIDKNFHLLGDQCLWWVVNDVGNVHTETGGQKMGVELQFMAYAYATCDPLNDQTFYRCKIANKSNNNYHDTYIGLWTDIDLGYPLDDYVGCDVMRNLGYAYNGVAVDGSGWPGHYGAKPPAAGIGIFQGPLADSNDGVDNDRDGTIDEQGEHLMMSHFMNHNYFPSGGGPQPSPDPLEDFYYYMKCIWSDGTPMYYGGSGHPSGGGDTSIPAQFMYPGDSDPLGYGTNGVPQASWSEESVSNVPYDRKLLVSSGPFTLTANETEYIHYGAIWARDTVDSSPMASRVKLFQAKDFCQSKFENDFQSSGCCPPLTQLNYQHNSSHGFTFSAGNDGVTYHWDFGDGSTSSERFPALHLFPDYGSYEVCLTVTNNCGTSTKCEIVSVVAPPICVRLKRIEGSGNMARYLDFKQGMHDTLFVTTNNRIYHPVYEFNAGPVRIEVLDSTLIPAGEMFIALNGIDSAAGWKMYQQGGTDTVYSTSTITIGDEQLITQWGLLVQVKQVEKWNDDCGFVLQSSIEQSANPWLEWITDTDYPDYTNWIHSGNVSDDANPVGNDYGDPNECFEHIAGGKWAPYKIASHEDGVGAGTWKKFKVLNKLDNLASVDIVITNDQSKWSRCPVFEIADDNVPAIGNARKMDLRQTASVDKNGNPDASGTKGMSWFPGYAVNVETGERLNMAFGENSFLGADNGQDMKWNPTSTEATSLGEPILGGGHYIYVFGHNGNSANDVAYYDEGLSIFNFLSSNNYIPSDIDKRNVFKDAMWVGIPMLVNGQQLIQSDVKIRLRVRKPYIDYQCLDQVINNTHPLYSFKSTELGLAINGEDVSNKPFQPDIFPNPAYNGQFSIRNNDSDKINLVELYGVSGELLISEGLNLDQFQTKMINCSALASGIYFVIIHTSKSAAIKKLVVR